MAPPQTHHVSSRRRVNLAGLVGLVAGAVAAWFVPWQLATLVGWVTLAGVLLAWMWSDIGPCNAADTQARSIREDDSRVTAVVVMVIASLVSLIGVGFALAKARHVERPMEAALTLVSVLAVVLSWCVVHTVFTVHYAHQYYIDPVGGIEFPGSAAPDYRDFAYYAFTVGMSFAVSDTDVTSREIRRITLRHARELPVRHGHRRSHDQRARHLHPVGVAGGRGCITPGWGRATGRCRRRAAACR